MLILFWWGILKETDLFEDVDVFDNIQMVIKEMGVVGVYCISLSQNKGEILVAVKTVMNIAFNKMDGVC